MIVENPFEEDFYSVYNENIISSYKLDFLKHNDKNTREGNLIQEALSIYLESKTGKILLPIQNIFWDYSEKKEFTVYKHQVVGIYDFYQNKIDLFQKGENVCLDIEEDKISIIFNFVYKYYNGD